MFKIRINIFFNLQYDFCFIFTIFEQQGKSAAWIYPRSLKHLDRRIITLQRRQYELNSQRSFGIDFSTA